MSQFEKLLIKNKNIINKALNLDNDLWGLEKSFEDLMKKIDNIELENKKNYLIIYQGEIDFTKELCEQSINKQANIIFILNDEYLATNQLIVRIANELIKQENLKNIIKLYNNVDDEKVFKGSNDIDEAIFIGSAFDYRNVKNKIKCPCRWIETEETCE